MSKEELLIMKIEKCKKSMLSSFPSRWIFIMTVNHVNLCKMKNSGYGFSGYVILLFSVLQIVSFGL